MSTSTMSSDVDEIRREMARIRMEMHQDVRDVVATAEAVTDWHRYLTNFPWLTVGAAFALGYFIVPRRKRTPATREDLSAVREAVEEARQTVVKRVGKAAAAAEPAAKKGLIASAIALAAPFAVRAAQGYAMSFFENWLAQQQEQMHAAAGPRPSPGVPPGAWGPPPSTGSGPGQGPRRGPGVA